jgi:hypothetical protein
MKMTPVTPLGIKPVISQLVAYCLNQATAHPLTEFCRGAETDCAAFLKKCSQYTG